MSVVLKYKLCIGCNVGPVMNITVGWYSSDLSDLGIGKFKGNIVFLEKSWFVDIDNNQFKVRQLDTFISSRIRCSQKKVTAP